jgi:hypothetical protein
VDGVPHETIREHETIPDRPATVRRLRDADRRDRTDRDRTAQYDEALRNPSHVETPSVCFGAVRIVGTRKQPNRRSVKER